MAEHSTVEMGRRAYEAFAKGDLDTVLSMQTDDVVWHLSGTGVLDGDYHGRDGVKSVLGKLMQETEGNFRLEVHDLLGNDEHGAALVRTHATRRGKTLASDVVHVTHVRDGLTAEFWAAPMDPVASIEFWS